QHTRACERAHLRTRNGGFARAQAMTWRQVSNWPSERLKKADATPKTPKSRVAYPFFLGVPISWLGTEWNWLLRGLRLRIPSGAPAVRRPAKRKPCKPNQPAALRRWDQSSTRHDHRRKRRIARTRRLFPRL